MDYCPRPTVDGTLGDVIQANAIHVAVPVPPGAKELRVPV